MESSIKQFGLNLHNDDDNDLKIKLNQSMRDLEIQNKRLRDSLNRGHEEEESEED
jgi:hypothetical protein